MPSLSGIALWIIGALLLVLVAGGTVEEVRIGNWESDYATQGKTLTETRGKLTTAENNVTRLQSDLDKQNAAVAALKLQASKLQAAAAARAKAAIAAKKKAVAANGVGPQFLNDWMNKEYGGVE